MNNTADTYVYEKDGRMIGLCCKPSIEEITFSVTHRFPFKDSCDAESVCKAICETVDVEETQNDTCKTEDVEETQNDKNTESADAEPENANVSTTMEKIDNNEYLVISTKASFSADEAEDLATYFIEVARMLTERYVWPKKLAEAKTRSGKRNPYVH